MLYPIKFTPVYKSKIWGGSKLNEFYSRHITATDIGESWEVSCRDDGMCNVSNGPLQGMSFGRLLETYGSAITGTRLPRDKFPLLLKILDVNTDLSVQVHPDTNYIANNRLTDAEEKNEMWYVLNAEDNATMVSGLKQGVTHEKLLDAIKSNKIESCLERSPVKTGDVIMIKTGCVHAAGAGVLLYELQQSSDTTYRLYDYERRDSNGNLRQLDIDKALNAINYEQSSVEFVNIPDYVQRPDYKIRTLIKNKSFCIDEVLLEDGLLRFRNNKNFTVYTVIKGNAVVRGNGVDVEMNEGESVFIPACLNRYVINGNCTLLCASAKTSINYT